MLASGNAFPNDAFFRDEGPTGADPRKGLWHPQVALLTRMASLDLLESWRGLPALIAPLFVLSVASCGFLVAGSAGAAVGAWALVLIYAGSTTANPFRQAVYSSSLVDQLALTAAVAVLHDVMRPERGRRLIAVGLALGAVTTHVYAAIIFAVELSALGLGLLLRDRGWQAQPRRLLPR